MLLKCRFLAQFSVTELSKNALAISQAEAQCPFMSHARRALSTRVPTSASSLQKAESSDQELHQNDANYLGASQECLLPESLKYPTSTTTTISDCTKIIEKKKFNDLIKNTNNQIRGGFDYEDFFNEKIESKKKDGSYRIFKKIARNAELFPQVQEKYDNVKRDVTIWCSNDYLGLGRHPYVQSQVCKAVQEYGVGSGGTRNISGSNPLHEQLESELAKYLHKLFNCQ